MNQKLLHHKVSTYNLGYFNTNTMWNAYCSATKHNGFSVRNACGGRKTLRACVEGISDFDYQKMRDLASEDFTLIENGSVWLLERLTTWLRKNEEKMTLSYQLSNMKILLKEPRPG